ncbi:hypothetical protein BD413DRAFT_137370 [Trametes elegans]|nr:hypothetical protein BD413DRAFT_137370 [Trametes elegans]
MAPVDKAKAAGVSASSFMDLKAQLAKEEEEFTKKKAAGKATAVVGGNKRNDKVAKWAKENPGVQARAARDIELETISQPTWESARAKLERKVQWYKDESRGKTGRLSDKKREELLVDFALKPPDPHFQSDSEDEDESLTVPVPPQEEQDDPVMEYQDEFGRTRTARRSEIPRELLPQPEKEQEEEDIDPYVVYNPVNHFPVYEPSAERVEKIRAEFAEENNPLNIHYDATREVRAKGAGFYQFSGDEETRRKQMEELRKAREETERTRAQVGAEDVRPGEVEGMGAQAGAAPAKSRAMEKRKRELEERRKLLEAKRRKVAGKEESTASKRSPVPDSQRSTSAASVTAAYDPFAALEAQSKDTQKTTKLEEPRRHEADSADAFLAQLARDIQGR